MAGPSKTIYWSIGKASRTLSLSSSSVSVAAGGTVTVTVTYTGDGTLSATSSNTGYATASVSGRTVTIHGVANGSAVITVRVAGTSRYDEATATVSVRVQGNVTVPTQAGSLEYSGSAKSPMWNDYDTAKMTIGGTTSATNAGSYTATFTLRSGYVWEDGTTGSKNVTWTIEKATPTITLTPFSLTVSEGETRIMTVTRPNNLAFTAVSSNKQIAYVTVSGYTVSVLGVNEGDATLTVTTEGTDNYYSAVETASIGVSSSGGSGGDLSCNISVANNVSAIDVYYSNGLNNGNYNHVTISRGESYTISVQSGGMVVIRSTSNDAGTLALVAGTGACKSVTDLREYSNARYGYPMRAYIMTKGGTFTWRTQ